MYQLWTLIAPGVSQGIGAENGYWDCGTRVDYGYGYYDPPKLYKSITIFKDETGFTAWVPRAGWEMLAREVPLQQARRIARARLAKGGHITDESQE